MKKSTIAAGIGAFIALTALLCINTDDKKYEKQKYFSTTNEVLEQLDNNPILALDGKGRMSETSQFNECLSKRKRLTYSDFHFKSMEIEKVDELDEKQKESILNDYNQFQSQLSMKPKITKIEPIRLEAKVNYPYDEKNKELSGKIDLVLIDEGEGLVIDYIAPYVTDEEKEKGDINVKG